jgi:hypothetical protein
VGADDAPCSRPLRECSSRARLEFDGTTLTYAGHLGERVVAQAGERVRIIVCDIDGGRLPPRWLLLDEAGASGWP